MPHRNADAAVEGQPQRELDLLGVATRKPRIRWPWRNSADDVEVDELAGVRAARREPPVGTQARQVGAEQRAADGVEDGVDAAAAGQLGDRLEHGRSR